MLYSFLKPVARTLAQGLNLSWMEVSLKPTLILGIFTALLTGLAIAVQAVCGNRAGGIIGYARTSLFINLTSGIVAFIVLLTITAFAGPAVWKVPRTTALLYILPGGILGVVIVMGVSFSLSFTGVTAGLASLVFGQMLVSSIIDATGWGGVTPIPLTLPRLAGAALVVLGVILLNPKT